MIKAGTKEIVKYMSRGYQAKTENERTQHFKNATAAAKIYGLNDKEYALAMRRARKGYKALDDNVNNRMFKAFPEFFNMRTK